jgi:hypothetical protein
MLTHKIKIEIILKKSLMNPRIKSRNSIASFTWYWLEAYILLLKTQKLDLAVASKQTGQQVNAEKIKHIVMF